VTRSGTSRRLRGIVTLVLLGGAVAALAVVVSRGRGGAGLPACARYVPHDSAFLFFVPSIREALLQQSKLLVRLKKNKVFGPIWNEFGGGVVRDLGFDLSRPDSIKVTGVDPSGGAVSAMSADGLSAMAALAVHDKEAMEKSLRRLVTRFRRSATFKKKTVGGVEVTVVGPDLAWGYHGSSVVFSLGSADGKPADHVARLTALKKSIQEDKPFKDMLGKVRGQQLVAYINGQTVGRRYKEYRDRRLKQRQGAAKAGGAKDDPGRDLSAYFKGAIVGLGVSGKRVDLTAFVGVPGDKGAKLIKLLSGKGKAPPLGEYILPTAVTAARGSVDVKMLSDWLQARMPPDARQQFRAGVEAFERRTGIKEQELFGLLAGRYALGVFAPTQDALAGGGSVQDRLARAAGGVLLVQVTDAKKASGALQKLAIAWKSQGVDIKVDRHRTGYRYCFRQQGQCLVSWAVARDMVVVTSSRHLAASLKLVDKGGESLLGKVKSSHARSTFRKDEGMIWYLDLYQVATLARKMTMPGMLGLTWKMYVQPASVLLSMLSDMALTMEPQKDGITGRLVITLK